MKAEQIEGFMDHEELNDLRREAAAAKVIVEIGVWHGRSTHALAEGNVCQPNGVIYAVDWFQGAPTDPCQCEQVRNAGTNGQGVLARAAFRRNLETYLRDGRVQLWELESTAAARRYAQYLIEGRLRSMDLLFIDGSHDTASLCADLDAWLPCLRSGGVLLLHDRNYPSVQSAVRDRLSPQPTDLAGSLWKWVKP